MHLEITRPKVELKESFLKGIKAFQAEGLVWYLDTDLVWIEANFTEFVQSELAKEFLRTKTIVPETKFWAVAAGQYVGKVSVRHELNDALKKMGGHIGYDTVPAFRGRGIGSEMLELVLPEARKIGLKKVLLTCDETNIPSIRIIEKCGGVLEKTTQIAEGKPPKRYYWIEL
jgi:predicted acetyltransferase